MSELRIAARDANVLMSMREAPRPIATFDLTSRCVLRCAHCYFFPRADAASVSLEQRELSDDEFLNKLVEVRDRLQIRSAFWIGGEPLLRRELLQNALPLFRRNAIATSGMLPIPRDLSAGWLVSVDGLAQHHDRLRGSGSFDRILRNIQELKGELSFAISTTITQATLNAISELPKLVETTRSSGVLVGFYVSRFVDPFSLEGGLRDRAIDALLMMKQRYPTIVLNTVEGIAQLRDRTAASERVPCMYYSRAVAFDTRLHVKQPCTFGAQASCEHCGCGLVAEQRAHDLGCDESRAVLQALFPYCRDYPALSSTACG